MRLLAAVLASALALPARADEGGVSAESGDTLFAEGTAVGLTYFRFRKTKLLDGTKRERNVAGAEEEANLLIGSVLYAIDVNTNVGVVAPYVDNSEDSGSGDATLFFKRRLFYDSDTQAGWAFTCAMAVALQLPTGESREDGVPPEEQPGSGSWDPFVGIAATYEWDRFFVNGFTNFQRNFKGSHDFKHGDIYVLGSTVGWRPWMEPYPGPMLVTEAGILWEHEFAAVDGGNRLDDSGADHVYATLRAKFSPRSGLNFATAIDYPLYRSYRGEQLATDYRFTLGVSHIF